MGIKDFFKGLIPISDNERYCLRSLRDFEEFDEIKRLIKKRRARFELKKFGISIFEDGEYFQVVSEDPELKNFLDKINPKIKKKYQKELFERFSKKAFEILPKCIASNILGLDSVKKAVALQLFAADNLHILLLGNAGVGKTDLVRAAAEFAPISSFGLGSGTSAAGLGVAMRGNKIFKGLLPMANGGLAAIDELNLMKRIDRTNLYSAMDKGFVGYDKIGGHLKVDAKISVLATANPVGGKFNRTLEKIKRQLPFDPALLQRFHLMFFIRPPDVARFGQITKKIVKDEKVKIREEDIEFIKDYIKYSESISVNFPKEFENSVTEFVENIKRREYRYLVEISPRLVIGLIRLIKASARMELRESVEQKDLDRAKEILKASLRV